jgi:hypothetical protein
MSDELTITEHRKGGPNSHHAGTRVPSGTRNRADRDNAVCSVAACLYTPECKQTMTE